MKRFNVNPVLLTILAISMVAVFIMAYHRSVTERDNNTVEILMDFGDMVDIAHADRVPLGVVVSQFKAYGVNSVAIYDATLADLARSNAIAMQSGESLLALAKAGESSPIISALADKKLINGGYTYVYDNNYTRFSDLQADLIRRYGEKQVAAVSVGGQRVLVIATNYKDIEKEPLGLPADQLQLAAKYGFAVVARPANFMQQDKEKIQSVFARMAVLPDNAYSGIMFAGLDVLGYKSNMTYTAALMKQHNLPLYVCESPMQLQFMKQDGLADMVRLSGYHAARCYVIQKEEQIKLQEDAMMRRFPIAVLERNIRVAFIRKIEHPAADQSLLQTNLNYVDDVRSGIAEKEFSFGRAGLYTQYYPAKWQLLLAALGIISVMIMLLASIFSITARMQVGLLIVLGIIIGLPIMHSASISARQACALVSAICFPVLAGVWMLYKLEHIKYSGRPAWRLALDGVGAIAGISVAALMGGIFIGTILGDTRFFLEAEIFRGVKVAFIMPPLLTALIFIRRYDLLSGKMTGRRDKLAQQLVKIWNMPVFIGMIVLFGVGAVIAWVLVGRSGDTSGVPVPAIELKMRYFLENVMYARPREKEFMIGYPAFFVAIFAFWKQWPAWLKMVLMMAVTVGLASSVETFCHLRSAIFLSTVRAFDGWLVGVVLGLIVFAALIIIDALYRRYQERSR